MGRRRLRFVLLGLATLGFVLLAVLLLGLPLIVDLPRVQALLRAEASRLLDRPVSFERVALSYWPLPAVRVTGLVVANPRGFGPEPFLSVREARVRVRLLPLLRARLQFGEVTLLGPRLVVEQRRDGAWNLPAPAAARPAPAAPFVLVSRVRLRDGRVEARARAGAGRALATHLVDRIDVTLEDLGWSAPIRFRVAARLPGGVAVELGGELGPLAAAGGNLAAVPARVEARLSAEEVGPPAGAPLAFTASGSGAVRVAGPLGQLAGDGRVAFSRVTLVQPRGSCRPRTPRTLVLETVELPVRVAGPTLSLRPFSLRVAGGTAQGVAAFTWGAGSPEIRLSEVRVRGIASEPVLLDFFCQPYGVAGRLDADGELAVTGVGEDLLRSARGRWQVRVAPGRLVGPAVLALVSGVLRVGAAISSLARLELPSPLGAPLEFQSLTAEGTVGGGQVRVADLRLLADRVRVAGRGTYGLVDARLALRLDVKAGGAAFGVEIGGTAAAPTYAPVLGASRLPDVLGPLFEAIRRAPRGTPGSADPGGSR